MKMILIKFGKISLAFKNTCRNKLPNLVSLLFQKIIDEQLKYYVEIPDEFTWVS